MSDLKKIRVQHVDRDAKGVEIKTDVDVITDADCITMDDGDLRSGVKKMIDDRIGEVIDGAPEELDTLKEIATELEKNQSGVSTIIKAMNDKLEDKDLEGYAKTADVDEKLKGKASTGQITMIKKRLSNNETRFNSIGERLNNTNVELDKKADKTEIADFKRCIILSSDAYSKLSNAEKAKSDTLYFLL